MLGSEIADFRVQIADLLIDCVRDCGTRRASVLCVNPKAEALKARTKRFALDVLDLIETLPRNGAAVHVGLQLADAATSVAANYRAACRGRSRAEFAAKIGVVLEECDESLFWLEICEEKRWGAERGRRTLLVEANELTAIFVQSSVTVRQSIEPLVQKQISNPPSSKPI